MDPTARPTILMKDGWPVDRCNECGNHSWKRWADPPLCLYCHADTVKVSNKKNDSPRVIKGRRLTKSDILYNEWRKNNGKEKPG